MASILSKLKTRGQTPVTGQTEAASKLLQAKKGRQATSQIPISAEKERAVAGQTAAQLEEVQRTGEQQAAGIELAQQEQAQKERQTADLLAQQEQEITQSQQAKINELEQAAKQAAEELNLNKEKAALEARLFHKKLNNTKYLNDLKNQASLERLYDEANFKKKMAEAALGSRTSRLLQDEKYKNIMSKEKVDWEEKMGALSVEQAMDLADAQIKDANQQAMWSAGTSLFTQGLDSYTDYNQQQKRKEAYFKKNPNATEEDYETWENLK